jgi:hypothetical protein
MEKQKSLDRLVTVSKIFRDARFEQLCRENAELRLQLFWKDHNDRMLKTVMEKVNKCNCWQCAVTGRMDKDDGVDDSKKCEFIPWFEEQLITCGITSGNVLKVSVSQHHISGSWNPVWDVDCHLVKIPMIGGDWSAFTYGLKLWKAKTVDDPELKKLEKLFNLLEAEGDE